MVNIQGKSGEFVMEGVADDMTQKMEFDGFDSDGRPINPRAVDKTPAEKLADNPPPRVIPDEDKRANMTRKEVQQLLDRVADLEARQ